MEALAAGVPVVARDLPVLREVLGDTVDYASTVDEMATAITTVVTGQSRDPGAGRRLAASYSWDAAARSHLELYRSLGEDPSGR